MKAKQELLELHQISEKDLEDFQSDNPGLCGLDTSRMSHLLLIQLATARKHRTIDTFSVTDVLQELEGVGRGIGAKTKPFKHKPLLGLWKSHFFDPRFLLRNIMDHWGLAYEHSPKFSNLCAKVTAEEEANPSPHGWQGRLAHQLTIEGLEQRAAARRLTGEWIIYGKHNNQNFYLGLARHTKNRNEDEVLFKKLKQYCHMDFPFILNDL